MGKCIAHGEKACGVLSHHAIGHIRSSPSALIRTGISAPLSLGRCNRQYSAEVAVVGSLTGGLYDVRLGYLFKCAERFVHMCRKELVFSELPGPQLILRILTLHVDNWLLSMIGINGSCYSTRASSSFGTFLLL
jgi:hypothetical protein